MPAGKQKLQFEVNNFCKAGQVYSATCNKYIYLCVFFLQGIFIKDSNSLAYYNMNNGATIHLALKERGGRKKWFPSLYLTVGIMWSCDAALNQHRFSWLCYLSCITLYSNKRETKFLVPLLQSCFKNVWCKFQQDEIKFIKNVFLCSFIMEMWFLFDCGGTKQWWVYIQYQLHRCILSQQNILPLMRKCILCVTMQAQRFWAAEVARSLKIAGKTENYTAYEY